MITSRRTAGAESAGLRDWIQMLLRRKAIVGGVALVVVGGASFFIFTTPTTYRAEAAVSLNVREVEISPVASIISELPQDAPVVRTEIDLISSRLMAERVMEMLDLQHKSIEELWPERPWWTTIRGIVGHGGRVLSGGTPGAQPGTDLQLLSDPRREIIDHLLSGLAVENDGRSYTIYIAFTAQDPVFAAEVANAYAEAYLDQQVEFQTSGIQNAAEWLGSKLKTMEVELERSELAVEEFRQNAGLTETTDGEAPLILRMNALNSEIAVARSERAAAEARLQTALELARTADGVEGFAEVLASPVIQSLRRDQAEIVRTQIQVEQFDALKATRVSTLGAERAQIEKQIDAEIDRVLASLASEVEVAKKKEQELQAALGELEAEFAVSRKAAIHLDHLEREANANGTLYESFLSRYKQTIEQDGLAVPEARLISVATPPHGSASSRLPLLGLALGAGLCGGISLAMVRDRLDRRIWFARSLEDVAGARSIALVPRVPPGRRSGPQQDLVTRPTSPYSLAIRRLAMTLHRDRQSGGSSVLMVTSANPREGKTATCAALARYMALGGATVVVVDANFHSPRIAAAFNAAPDATLNDVLSGKVAWTSATAPDPRSPARLIAATPYRGDTGGLVGSAAFAGLLSSLKSAYDVVIVETPSVLRSPDAGAVGAFADTTLMVVRWGVTIADDVALALHQLGLCRTTADHIVLNGVAPRAYRSWQTHCAGGRPGLAEDPRIVQPEPLAPRGGRGASGMGEAARGVVNGHGGRPRDGGDWLNDPHPDPAS